MGMDPRHLFSDDRLTGLCVYCGNQPSTRDHVPSRVLLDKPYPPDLPVVESCERCNASFALHEQYVACLVECALVGSCAADAVRRDKIRRILCDTPALASRLAKSRQEDDSGGVVWTAEVDRVREVALKLARGHVAYEFSEPRLDEPEHVGFVPFAAMSQDQRQAFESSPPQGLWPEIGSRAFIRAAKSWAQPQADAWRVVQDGRYRYSVTQSDEMVVRMVLSEYLACEVVWL